jgi:AcrR family transcriptional regulator
MPRPWSKQPVESLDAAQLEALGRRREQIVAAAERLMGARGPGVTMAEVAAEAELGMSSVYRTFASKDELLDELAGRRAERWVQVWEEAAAFPDAREALTRAMLTFGELEAVDPLADVVRDYVVAHWETFRPVSDAGEAVVRRAHEAGLRRDVVYDDIVRLFQMLAALPEAPDRAWRRALAIYVDGLFAADSGPLPPATSGAETPPAPSS